ncbi:hypothetical protein [Candidatus Phytoplasma australasiaticum]|nr:hypothetical protein [Sweet potato little leaf phytoplasma]MDO8008860.1 hypothetical protein [Sweet potato little leaf phytoplasma]MDO8020564.1 hypothetical protein [Sweet potato little leaf phytoplasma]MDV3151785.1 hypothetical protein [Sweet potato little leaf phytoplasma]MDV3172758.1 hypothetical protein [Sweet potato little leaf phytoplasma]MDV3198902.1 hypothetical protein [Sweet potato little leaf phytoplasma]
MIDFILKQASGIIAKLGFAVHKIHCIIYLVQKLFCHLDGTLKIMPQ